VIRELEVELAIADAEPLALADELVQFSAVGIDIAPVREYGRRYAKVVEAAGFELAHASAGGFMLGFRLGVLAARRERMDA
jgi:hypothetical protein